MPLPISQFREFNDLVFTAGQIGRRGDELASSFAGQVEAAIENLRDELERAGTNLESVTKVTNFVVRREDVAEMNEIYERYFSDPWPARSTLVTGLVSPEILFEIEAVAYRSPR